MQLAANVHLIFSDPEALYVMNENATKKSAINRKICLQRIPVHYSNTKVTIKPWYFVSDFESKVRTIIYKFLRVNAVATSAASVYSVANGNTNKTVIPITSH